METVRERRKRLRQEANATKVKSSIPGGTHWPAEFSILPESPDVAASLAVSPAVPVNAPERASFDGGQALVEVGGCLVEPWSCFAQAAGVAPLPSNTGATNRHFLFPSLLPGGIDTLHLSIYASWLSSKWDALKLRLEECKQKSQKEHHSGVFHTSVGEVLVHSKGVAHGGEKFVIGCRWVLECQGVRIHVADQQTPRCDSMANVFVLIGSNVLVEHGHVAAWEFVKTLLFELGCLVTRNVVSRVDLCVDVPKLEVTSLVKRFHKRQFCTQARKFRDFIQENGTCSTFWENLKATGFWIGKGIVFRCYDKAFEVRNDPTKKALLEERRGLVEGEALTRCEFQLRRDHLRDLFSVTSAEDLFTKLGSITEELTTDWLRFCTGKIDRENGNQHRAKTCPEWLKIQKLFKLWTESATAPAPRKAALKPDTEPLRRQSFGCLVSLLGLAGEFGPNASPHEYIWQMIAAIPDSAWSSAAAKRASQFVRRGVPVRMRSEHWAAFLQYCDPDDDQGPSEWWHTA